MLGVAQAWRHVLSMPLSSEQSEGGHHLALLIFIPSIATFKRPLEQCGLLLTWFRGHCDNLFRGM